MHWRYLTHNDVEELEILQALRPQSEGSKGKEATYVNMKVLNTRIMSLFSSSKNIIPSPRYRHKRWKDYEKKERP